MIIDRFGSDLQKIYEANAKRFSRKTVLQLSLRIVCEPHFPYLLNTVSTVKAACVEARSSAGWYAVLH